MAPETTDEALLPSRVNGQEDTGSDLSPSHLTQGPVLVARGSVLQGSPAQPRALVSVQRVPPKGLSAAFDPTWMGVSAQLTGALPPLLG